MAKDNQETLFDLDEHSKWKEEWKGMPEFNQEDLTSWKSIIVHFESDADMKEFAKLVNQKLTYKTRSIWFPEAEIGRMSNKLFIQKEPELFTEEIKKDDTTISTEISDLYNIEGSPRIEEDEQGPGEIASTVFDSN